MKIRIVNRHFPAIQVAAGLVLLAGCAETEKAGETEEPVKPNIVYILADDLGYGDLSCYGQEKFKTPNIDRMADQGMSFLQHYSGSTVCAPSRSALMTGLHTGHTYVRGNKEMQPEGQHPLPDSILTIPEHLKKAGYVTGGFGKWGLGGPGSEGDPVFQGIDNFFGYNCQRLAHNYYPEYLWDNRDTVFLTGNDNRGTGQYAPDLIQKERLQFIEDNRDTSFFLFVPSIIPHAELLVPDDSIFRKFSGKWPETPYEGVDEGPNYRKGPYGSQENPRATFAAMVTRLDLYVGEILDKLEELGIDENTLVIFTSDNGPHLEGGADPDFFNSNGQYRGYKRDLYEGGIRVPMIAWWPGKIKEGSQTGHTSAFWDVFPTASELAGLPVPEYVDGISFLPTLLGEPGQEEQDHLYWEFHEQGGKQAVLLDNWKGVKLDVNKDPEAPVELYNLENDPGEENNVADEHPEIVQRIDSIMNAAHEPSQVFRFGFEK